MNLICTSQAYQMQAVPTPSAGKVEAFRGPLVRRMSAEQFVDALSQLTDVWQTETPAMSKADKRGQGGQLKAIRGVLDKRNATSSDVPLLRAAIVDADALLISLGRPNREQVVSRRETVPTPLESLEFTNGAVLDGILKKGAEAWLVRSLPTGELVDAIYLRALGRKPNSQEQDVALELIGTPPTASGIQDFLWTILMLPDFQFIE
jgi:hypothetical protein